MNASILSENVISFLALIEFVAIISVLVTNSMLRKKFSDLKDKYKKLKSEKGSLSDIDPIIPGDNVHFTSALSFTDAANTKHSFSVTYEANVTEISSDKVKVSPYAVQPDGRLPTEFAAMVNHKQHLLNYLKDKWVDKKEVSKLMGLEDIRNKKIDKLIN